MADQMRSAKSDDDSLREGDRFDLPTGETVEVPIEQSIEHLMKGNEALRRYWAEHFFDPEESTNAKNPVRFEI